MQKVTQEEVAKYLYENRYEMLRFVMSLVENYADAEDVVGEAIIKVLEKREQLRYAEKLKSWTMTIVANCAKDLLKKRNRISFVNIEEVEIKDEQDFVGECDELWSIIQQFSVEYRMVLVLYYYNEFTIEEISKALKIPIGTVKSRLARGRDKIAMELL